MHFFNFNIPHGLRKYPFNCYTETFIFWIVLPFPQSPCLGRDVEAARQFGGPPLSLHTVFFGHCYQSIMPVCDGLCFCSPKLIQYQHFIPLVAEYSLVPRHVSFWFGENSFPHSTVLLSSFSSFHLIDRFNQFSLWLNTGYNSAKLGDFPYH